MKQKRILPVFVMAGAFLFAHFLKVNIIVIILVCGVIGAFDTLYREKFKERDTGI